MPGGVAARKEAETCPTGVLAGPRVQLAVGTAALLAPAMAVRRNRVGPGEAKRWLSAVNGNEFAA